MGDVMENLTPDQSGVPTDWPGSPLSTLHHRPAQMRSPSEPSPESDGPTIVVGVSGSPASARALRWAVAEAGRLQGRLRVVLIWTIEPRAYYAPAISAADYERRQRRAVSGLAAMVRTVAGSLPPHALTTYVAHGLPERALVEQSAGADLLVLGSATGLGGPPSIGPVIRACLSHAHCPVVVVGLEGPLSHSGHGRSAPRPDEAVTQLPAEAAVARSAPGRSGVGAGRGSLRSG
jgi:nucleotide-binding universal stress UspA family protein